MAVPGETCTFTSTSDSQQPKTRSMTSKPPRRPFGEMTNVMAQLTQLTISIKQSIHGVPEVRRQSDSGASTKQLRHSCSTSDNRVSAAASGQRGRPARRHSVSQISEKTSRRLLEKPVPEVGSGDVRHALRGSEYADEVNSFYHRVEASYLPSDYMTSQPSITPWMRSLLIDFMVKAHVSFQLRPEVLYLAVNLTDRVLEHVPILRRELQLVGATALLLAAKSEGLEGNCSAASLMSDLMRACDGSYSRKQIISMEWTIFSALKFKVIVPTHHQFLDCYIQAAGLESDEKFRHLCNYIVQLSLPEYDMLEHSYSEVSAAAVHVALEITRLARGVTWPTPCEEQSGYGVEALQPAKSKLYRCLAMAGPSAELPAVYNKYCKPDFATVASHPILRRLQSSPEKTDVSVHHRPDEAA